MSEYVLFSPLGMSDPTRGCRDGAFIHICRKYRPKKAYLYMSKEICEYDELDNRYEKYLSLLCEKLDFKCDVKKIKRPDLVKVNDFEAFYGDFSKIMESISSENPGCDILINLSSGTAQMKSALLVLGTLFPKPLTMVQVSTPSQKSNDTKPVGKDYDIYLEWELNEDNYEDYSDEDKYRCFVSKSENLNARIMYETVGKHILAYDYKAALTVAENIKDFMDTRALNLINAGFRRLILDLGNAERFAENAGYDLLPINEKRYNEKEKVVFEYILTLKIKREKGEIADFVRAVSPVLTDMFEIYLKNKCNIDIESYYLKDPYGRYAPKLSRNLLPADIIQILDSTYASRGGYRDTEPCAANLSPIVAAKGDAKAGGIAVKLRSFEGRVRNIAAHEIVVVTEKWIKERSGFNTGEVLKMLMDFFSCCIDIPQNTWNSYEQLNKTILEIPLLK
ncbi:hypothetical protein CDQ84_08225 [Clostridium thermosuccinogenes]|uniref:CRISPR-associated protein Csm6 n=1 Tax=Clostridium thermosuccinogenes TaxID=84032 RepID=A0A2K2FLB1_9CLOT|nr:hypothetical protein CDO33_09465 [Pseudoclostridium thermosuccinogenes]PNT97562.1 hypothetical protein CDQ85_08070 [Pseudoclostridium thermosuccinogenes]PNT99558.1 hypothetical protein CDQ84_08225 [Pseudoclostridium thermosuccinogenes]